LSVWCEKGGARKITHCKKEDFPDRLYLSQYQLLPFEPTGEILRDLYGCESFSQGTLANFHADCAARLEPVEAAILQ
jgi:hypothetical protein